MTSDRERNSAENGWTILRVGGIETSGLGIPTKLSGVTSPDGAVRYALGANGEPRLLLPLSGEDKPSLVQGAPALDVTVSEYSESGQPKRFLDLTCLMAELETVFAEVTEQILERVARGANCVEATRSTIEDFRALLIRPPSNDVSREKTAGLVGELLVLNRLLARSAEAWQSWNGPESDRHDFAKGSNALEVKVTMRKGKRTISVNGLEQLAEPAGGRLFLQHFEMEAAASGILSVSGLGRSVLAGASKPEKVKELLSAIGCRDVDDIAWNATSFRLENETLYEIGEGFPRLVSSSFPQGVSPKGVSGVSYVADLSEATNFRIESEASGEIEELFVR